MSLDVILAHRRFAGSAIGGIAETQEMLDFCAEHDIASGVEQIPIQKINEAYDRLLKGDVKYRFVIDMASLKARRDTAPGIPSLLRRTRGTLREPAPRAYSRNEFAVTPAPRSR
nr:hypothetical protein [Fimbriiglobus ruber]